MTQVQNLVDAARTTQTVLQNAHMVNSTARTAQSALAANAFTPAQLQAILGSRGLAPRAVTVTSAQRNVEAAVQRILVGQLHEKFQFPSDHLPIGVEANKIRIVSWNGLNTAFMKYIDQNLQGLKGSMITQLNVPIAANSKLTHRDVAVVQFIQEMMESNDLIALQECGAPFLQYLQEKLPANWKMIKSFDTQKTDQIVVLYNTNRLTYHPNLSETTLSAYPSAPDSRPVQSLYFSDDQGQALRVVHAHIPGDPKKPCAQEFAQYVKKQYKENCMTVALGDHNCERERITDAYRQAGFSDFKLYSPWRTIIADNKQAKCIDHIAIFGNGSSRDLQPNEILKGDKLQKAIALLNPSR